MDIPVTIFFLHSAVLYDLTAAFDSVNRGHCVASMGEITVSWQGVCVISIVWKLEVSCIDMDYVDDTANFSLNLCAQFPATGSRTFPIE